MMISTKSSTALVTFLKFDRERFIVPQSTLDVHEKDLMEIETRCFEEDIQESWESKQDLIRRSDVVLFAFSGSKIIGEAYTAKDGAGDMGEEGNKDTVHLKELFEKMKEENGVYFMSFAVLPEYQGVGTGERMVRKTLSYCKEAGFKVLYTHANEGASEHLFMKCGGKFVERREDWFGTGNAHVLLKIIL